MAGRRLRIADMMRRNMSVFDVLAEEAQARERAWLTDEAGESALRVFGLQSWLTTWLLRVAPELLALTPSELVRGFKAPHCPVHTSKPMKLRVADAAGRLPKRLVWRCFDAIYRGGFAEPCGEGREVEPWQMPRPEVRLKELIEATQDGAVVDYQRNPATKEYEVQFVRAGERIRRSK